MANNGVNDQNRERIYHSIRRILFELLNAISMRNAINKLVKEAPVTNWGFFSYAYLALRNDLISHEIKIFDKHPEAASFWYLYKCIPTEINPLLKKHELDLENIELFTLKMIEIRDKTHFHIDKKDVLNPEKVWKRASVTGNHINMITDKLWLIMNDLYSLLFGNRFGQPIYEGNDIEAIINAVKEKGIEI